MTFDEQGFMLSSHLYRTHKRAKIVIVTIHLT